MRSKEQGDKSRRKNMCLRERAKQGKETEKGAKVEADPRV